MCIFFGSLALACLRRTLPEFSLAAFSTTGRCRGYASNKSQFVYSPDAPCSALLLSAIFLGEIPLSYHYQDWINLHRHLADHEEAQG